MESVPPLDRSEPRWFGSAGLIFAVVLAAYLPALRGGFLWDDHAHVTSAALRSIPGLGRIWFELGATQQYYPVLHSAFWLEHRLWGDAVLGYHLLNVALHAAAAWLMVRVLRQLDFPAAGLAGLAFALHPVAVESVAWISEQKNTLSAVFYLGAGLGYLRFDTGRKSRDYWAAAGLFVLALLTKSVTATLPAALLVAMWWKRGKLDFRREVSPLLPWLAVGITSGLFTAWVEKTYIGAAGTDFALGTGARMVLAGRVILFYAGKVIWPSRLMFIYPRWVVDAHAASQWVYFVGVVVALALLAVGTRKRRGPLAAALFFVGTLFPALGFVNVYPFVYSFVADHFQYLACVGMIAVLAWGWTGLVAWIGGLAPGSFPKRLERSATQAGRSGWTGGRGIFVGMLLVWPAALGVLTARQARAYRDADTLNRATIAANPDAWLAHYNLAVSLGDQPNGLAAAIAEYRTTLRLNPGHWAAHCNLASALLKVPGHTDEAIREYETALRLNPDFAEAHNDLAVVLSQIPGQTPDAVEHWHTAIRLHPEYLAAHANLARALARLPGQGPAAATEYQTALRLAPNDPALHFQLGVLRAGQPGQLAAATAEFETVLRLQPDSAVAHYSLAVVILKSRGSRDEAVAHLQAALKLRPDLDVARQLLERLSGSGGPPLSGSGPAGSSQAAGRRFYP